MPVNHIAQGATHFRQRCRRNGIHRIILLLPWRFVVGLQFKMEVVCTTGGDFGGQYCILIIVAGDVVFDHGQAVKSARAGQFPRRGDLNSFFPRRARSRNLPCTICPASGPSPPLTATKTISPFSRGWPLKETVPETGYVAGPDRRHPPPQSSTPATLTQPIIPTAGVHRDAKGIVFMVLLASPPWKASSTFQHRPAQSGGTTTSWPAWVPSAPYSPASMEDARK